ncbi:hypothetical protein Tco_0881869 [Tanacetum coccineum]
MKEQAYNKDKDQKQDSRTQRQSNLKKSKNVYTEARNLPETKLQGRLLASKYQVQQGSSFQGLDLTYASSIITPQKPTEREFDLLFEAMYDDYIGGQPSATPRTAPAAPAP